MRLCLPSTRLALRGATPRWTHASFRASPSHEIASPLIFLLSSLFSRFYRRDLVLSICLLLFPSTPFLGLWKDERYFASKRFHFFFFFLKNCWFNFSEKREIQWLLFLDWIFFDSYLIKGRMVFYIPFFLVQFLKSLGGLVSFILILHPKNYIFFLAASSLLTSFSSFLKFLTKQCHSSFFVVPSSISLLDSLYFLLKILLL